MTALDLTILTCPQWTSPMGGELCGNRIEILSQCTLESTEGPVPHVQIRCHSEDRPDGHVLNGPIDSLWSPMWAAELAVIELDLVEQAQLESIGDLAVLVHSGEASQVVLDNRLGLFTQEHPEASAKAWRAYVDFLADSHLAA